MVVKINNLVLAIIILSFIILGHSGCTSNQKLIGRAFYYENVKSCTLVLCLSDPCCNDCNSALFLITEQDTIQVYGTRIDTSIICTTVRRDTTIIVRKKQPLVCRGKECETLKCTPLEFGKIYEVTGKFLPQTKESVKKAFNVMDYKFVK